MKFEDIEYIELLEDYAEYIRWKGSLKELWNLVYNYSNGALYLDYYQNKLNIEKNRSLESFYKTNTTFLSELVRWNIERYDVTKRIVKFAMDYNIKNAFDFGYGIGTDLIELNKNGVEYDGYEINDKCIRFFKWRQKKHNIDISEVAPKLYDLVICLDVLEHIEDPIGKLYKLASTAKYMAVNFAENYDNNPFHLKENEQYLSGFQKIVSGWKKIDTDIYEVIR